MDTVFNIKRFGSFAKRELTYSWKTYVYVILGVIAYYILAQLMDSIWQMNLTILLPALAVILITCAIPLMDKNMNKANFIPFFTTPISTFERWLLLWLKAVIIMPILVIATIFLLHQISPMTWLELATTNTNNTKEIWANIHGVLAWQSIFFFGYIYFRKRALIKIIIAITVFIVLVNLLSNVINSQFYPEIAEMKKSIDITHIFHFYMKTTIIYDICQWTIKLIFPFGLWIASYFRLRETDI